MAIPLEVGGRREKAKRHHQHEDIAPIPLRVDEEQQQQGDDGQPRGGEQLVVVDRRDTQHYTYIIIYGVGPVQ